MKVQVASAAKNQFNQIEIKRASDNQRVRRPLYRFPECGAGECGVVLISSGCKMCVAAREGGINHIDDLNGFGESQDGDQRNHRGSCAVWKRCEDRRLPRASPDTVRGVRRRHRYRHTLHAPSPERRRDAYLAALRGVRSVHARPRRASGKIDVDAHADDASTVIIRARSRKRYARRVGKGRRAASRPRAHSLTASAEEGMKDEGFLKIIFAGC